MKKDNRYTRALEQIRPEENFENDTLNKLSGAGARRNQWRVALPAAAALTLVLIAVLALPPLFGKNSAPVGQPQPTGVQSAYVEQKNTPDAQDEAPTPTAQPLPVPTPGIDGGDRNAFLEMAELEDCEPDVCYAQVFLTADESYAMKAAWNTEEYSAIRENGYQYALTSPLSTFAADVDTASYTVVRRKLLEGEMPSQNAVRIEEMLNYFHYADLAPADGAPVAISAYLGACPWNEQAALMFVGIGARSIETRDLPRSNLVFLIDTSGSMDGSDRLDLAKRAFHLLADTLQPGDTVSVVTYSGSFRVLLEGVDASHKAEILDAIDSLEAYGSTNGGDAIVTAYDIAKKHYIEGGNNRVIMMTDGDLNVGITSESELVGLIEEKRDSGIFLSVLGFGMGNYKDNKLEALADHGNGVYSYIDGITEARRTLVTEMGANFYTVAKDVKIQVEFNPEYVEQYRLVGYENRLMAAEDFLDETKDGGEMGSGHTVVALYELIPAEGRTIAGVSFTEGDDGAPDLRYQRTEPTRKEEIAQISLRYKQPEGGVSSQITVTVSPDDLASSAQEKNLKKAAAIAEFGLLLRNSEYKAQASYENAFDLIRSLSDLSEEESELMYLISVARGLSE